MDKILFIFSNDFGELVLLRLLVYQQPIHAYLALPERLFGHVDFPNVTKFLYKDADDLKNHIEEIHPTQVMLFSAYLLAPNKLITYTEFYSLLDYLDEKKITVSTSDPFMRYYDQLSYDDRPSDFRTAVRNQLKGLSERLAVYRHLYGVPVQFDGAPCQSFSNHFKIDIQPDVNRQKQWTFIMAAEDFSLLQIGNNNEYQEILIPLFTALVKDHDICVNLVFPESLCEILRANLPDVAGINYVSYCSLDAFERLVAQSDLMIYWNVFSASTLLCRLYSKPTVFLGHGHMENIFPGFFDYIKSSWFPHKAPEVFQIDDTFIPALLKRLENVANGFNDNALYQPYYELDSPTAVFSFNTSLS
nr:hypothetical protein [uncultured Pedobacter sp.]